MSAQIESFLHYNRGVPKLRFTIRTNREIRMVRTKPFNAVFKSQEGGPYFIVTKGLCQSASRLVRLKLKPYTGKWPRLALVWTRLKEVVRG